MRAGVRWLAVLAVWAGASASFPASPILAHDGRGAIEFVAAEPTAPFVVMYRVRVTYSADSHPVDDATVTVLAVGADGQQTVPQPMTRASESGSYTAELRFPGPGAWTVRATSVKPPATAEVPEMVAPGPAGVPVPTATTTGAQPTTADSAPESSAVVASMVAAGLALGLAVLWARRRSRSDTR